MARLHLGVGTRYAHQGHVYVVRQLLADDRLLIENQSFGGQRVLTREDIIAAWATGTLVFEIAGPHTQATAHSTLTSRVSGRLTSGQTSGQTPGPGLRTGPWISLPPLSAGSACSSTCAPKQSGGDVHGHLSAQGPSLLAQRWALPSSERAGGRPVSRLKTVLSSARGREGFGVWGAGSGRERGLGCGQREGGGRSPLAFARTVRVASLRLTGHRSPYYNRFRDESSARQRNPRWADHKECFPRSQQ